MENAFLCLGLPERLAFSEEELREKWHALSREGAQASANQAWETLRSSARRARHLLTLRAPEVKLKGMTISEPLFALFDGVGRALDTVGSYLEAKEGADSALAKALLVGRQLEAKESLDEMTAKVSEAISEIEKQFPEWDREPERETLARMAADLGFLEKWLEQLRQKQVELF
ncbi:MAG: hypothetical protein AAF555_02360 [Verrucomicrobiota bacterium]